ncbi:hypothetical protein M4I21_00545 [Cellulophaga sp. 20_2_10]|uniref:hypothetical protein n=1 Tax=Cellulophaga sp. 20_2_10 TaxID=2942476 RepID=UPI00201AAFA3|nr:hypothetical protein [Cellulophaga sp. 20_2_10]MCL5244277.1 hypothetical protein [Cellulophaga sp. 20_2_10]
MNNLLYEVKYAVETHFKFLQNDFKFKPFKEVPLAYEYHFKAFDEAKNHINIHIELIASTPIWITFNGVYIEELIKDDLLDKYNKELHYLYDKNFKSYLKTKDVKYISANIDNYNLYGNSINNKRLQRIGGIVAEKFYSLVKASHDHTDAKKKEYLKETEHINSCNLEALKELTKNEEFKEQFKQSKKLVLDTDKCEIDVASIEELTKLITTFSSQNFNNFEWHFIK